MVHGGPISSAFRSLPWWLRLGLAYLALPIAFVFPIGGLAMLACSLLGRCDPSYVMLGCTIALISLPVSAIVGVWLRDEIRYAVGDPDRPAVRQREAEAIARVRERHRRASPE
ncbi:MAG: hypothetical protein JXA09_13270 [Anaerolineae bacterium]|nr:hypothetical protein [Anaerolineae bacterium]